jgi:hypothetical protein
VVADFLGGLEVVYKSLTSKIDEMSILQAVYFCKMSMESTIASSVKKQKIPTMEQHALKDVSNGKESTINRALGGSTYPG